MNPVVSLSFYLSTKWVANSHHVLDGFLWEEAMVRYPDGGVVVFASAEG